MAKINLNLEPVKKHASAVACGAVALGAVIAGLWPLGGYKQELQAQLDASVSTKSAIEGLLSKSRSLPPVAPDTTEAKPLEAFPSAKIIEQGEELVKRVTAQSHGLLDEVIKLNTHPLLVPNSLPMASPSQKLTFRDWYKQAIESTIPDKILNAGFPPSERDVQQAVDLEAKNIEATESIPVNGQIINREQVMAKIQLRRTQLPQEMREAVAKNHKLYIGNVGMGANMLPVYDALTVAANIINAPQAPDEVSIWTAQLGLWIQQDVAQALAALNKNAKCVIDAPVKHLLKLTWNGQYVLGAQPGTPSSVDATAQIQPMKQFSPTGRVCCPMYDVVHFDVKLRVVADKIPQVIQELERNRLITVLKTDITAYDTAAAAASGYFYGEDPVVEVTFQCEELFLRKWTVPLMPTMVKKYLGISDAPPAAS